MREEIKTWERFPVNLMLQRILEQLKAVHVCDGVRPITLGEGCTEEGEWPRQHQIAANKLFGAQEDVFHL